MQQNIIEQLINLGYKGTIEYTNKYPSGIKDLIGDRFSYKLS